MPADEELKVAACANATERERNQGDFQQTSLRQYQLDQVQRVAMPRVRRWPLSPLSGLP